MQAAVNALLVSVAEAMTITEAEARSRYDSRPGRLSSAGRDSTRLRLRQGAGEGDAPRGARGRACSSDLVRDLRARARIETYI